MPTQDKKPDWEKSFDNEFPSKIAYVVEDFGSTVKGDIKQFIQSQISQAEQRGYNSAIDQAVGAINTQFELFNKAGLNSYGLLIYDIVQSITNLTPQDR